MRVILTTVPTPPMRGPLVAFGEVQVDCLSHEEVTVWGWARDLLSVVVQRGLMEAHVAEAAAIRLPITLDGKPKPFLPCYTLIDLAGVLGFHRSAPRPDCWLARGPSGASCGHRLRDINVRVGTTAVKPAACPSLHTGVEGVRPAADRFRSEAATVEVRELRRGGRNEEGADAASGPATKQVRHSGGSWVRAIIRRWGKCKGRGLCPRRHSLCGCVLQHNATPGLKYHLSRAQSSG
jgi:hypothetical protein